MFERDKFRCQCCKSKNGNGKSVILNAHHIFNFKDYPSIRYDINNGMTLCQVCHLELHLEYGKSNNNSSQIKEFISKYGKNVC